MGKLEKIQSLGTKLQTLNNWFGPEIDNGEWVGPVERN